MVEKVEIGWTIVARKMACKSMHVPPFFSHSGTPPQIGSLGGLIVAPSTVSLSLRCVRPLDIAGLFKLTANWLCCAAGTYLCCCVVGVGGKTRPPRVP